MNSVNVMGRLVADAELRKTNSGKSVCSVRLAVDAGKDKKAYFFSVVAWNGTAENICKYFGKGDKIAISGILTSREYEHEGKNITVVEILANSFDFCESKKANAQPDEAEPAAQIADEPTQPSGLPFEL